MALFELTYFQIHKATTIQSVQVAGTNLQCLVAISQRGLQFANDGARPAAVVESFGVLWIETDRLVEIFDRTGKIPVLRKKLTAPVERGGILRIELNRLVEISDSGGVQASNWLGRNDRRRRNGSFGWLWPDRRGGQLCDLDARQVGKVSRRMFGYKVLPSFPGSNSLRGLVVAPHLRLPIGRGSRRLPVGFNSGCRRRFPVWFNSVWLSPSQTCGLHK